MALTEEMKRWNQRVEEEMKKTRDIKYLDSFPKEVQEMYIELRGAILNLYPNIQIIPKKNYISFKSKTNFLDVQPQSRLLKCVINIKSGKLRDSKKISRDISKLGHFGIGDYDFSITSLADIENVLDLIIQSYKINS